MMQELARIKQAILVWTTRGVGEGHADHLMRLTVAAIVLLFPAACLLVDRSDSLSLLLLLVIGLSVWARDRFKTGFTRREWLYVTVFIGFFAAGVLAFEFGHQTDSGFRLLGRYLRLLLVLPALMALRRYRPPALSVWAGLGLGALALGLDAAWERAFGGGAGLLRVNNDSNASILLGDLGLLTSFALAAGAPHISTRIPRSGPWLVGLCVFAGLVACFLSGTRGAWVAVPVLLILLITCSHLLRPRVVVAAAVGVLVLFAGLYLLPQTQVRERFRTAVSQYKLNTRIHHGMRRMGDLPACLSDSSLMRAWTKAAVLKPVHGLKLRVRREKGHALAGLQHYGCSGRLALHLQNKSADRVHVSLPRVVQPKPGRAHICMLVSGHGVLIFGKGAPGAHRFRDKHYKAMEVSAEHDFAEWVTIVVPPHTEVRVVPMELFAGEYSYAALRHSSVAERLSMWTAAWRMFRSAPVLGTGTGTYMSEARGMVDAGLAPPVVAVYDHPHDEYLDALSSRGVVGLLALLALFGVPLWLFQRTLGSTDPARMGASLAGLMLTVGFVIFGLTETMFVHSVVMAWYVIMTAIFMVTAEPAEDGVK